MWRHHAVHFNFKIIILIILSRAKPTKHPLKNLFVESAKNRNNETVKI